MNDADATVHDELFDSLLGDFLDESAQLLERLNANLLRLDEWVRALDDPRDAACDLELLNDMFRAAHSLKGLSAMLGLRDINNLVHKVENVFDAARSDKLRLTGETVEMIFSATDHLAALVECLKDPASDVVDCTAIGRRIQEVLRDADVEPQANSSSDAERIVADADDASNQPPAEPGLRSASQSALSSRTGAQSVTTDAPQDHFSGIHDEEEVPPKYLSIFIDEAFLSLDTLTETLLNLEATGGRKAVEDLLITSHRIKGSAACVGLHRAAKLAHLMEDLVQRLRDQGDPLTPPMADAMLKSTDALRTYVEGLKRGSPDPQGFAHAADELISSQTARPAGAAPPASEPSELAEPGAAVGGRTVEMPAPRIPIADDLMDVVRVRILSAVSGRGAGLYGVVTFTPGLALVGLKARLAYEKLAQLGEVFYCEPSADTLDELEELPALAFAVATESSVEVVRRQLRLAGIDRVEAALLPTEASAAEAAAATAIPSSADASVAVAAPARQPIAAASGAISASSAPAGVGKPSLDAEPQKGGTDATARPTETLRVDIERLDQLMNLAGQLVINKARFSRIEDSLKQATAGGQAVDALASAAALVDRITALVDAAPPGGAAAADLESVRAHSRRVQGHLDCVRGALEQLAAMRGSVNDLGEAVHQLDRVADGIQKSVMDTRMVPIGPLFGRFRRVIRDMTRANGKDIRLVIRGEKTELDKRMIDELGDPLIHMVRNAADHGIETPSERLAAGKPREGTITLDAFQRGNSITIQVRDDGRGLDQNRIRAKAIEKGIVSPADAEKLTPHQIYQLVWEPGFSTAEKVTEISGRGMGMDIVKSKIEDINGAVELDSVAGEGTTLTIKLPLTLAILPSLMAEIEGDVFALPIESVVEIVSVGRDDLTSVHGLPSAVVRGRVVSVASLAEIFTWVAPPSRAGCSPGDEVTLVIVGSDGRELGLVVDRLLGEEDIVIKSMAENYQNVYGVAGASILGDGRVSLILDTGVLIDIAAKGMSTRQWKTATCA